MGCGTTNSCDSASTGNAATHIATRRPNRGHDAGNIRGTSANSDHRTTQSDHNATELDDDAANYNDRATYADHNQGGRAWHPACSAAQ